ncbi:MATE family efflux transporter [Nonomuraea sp. NPDC050310]|uniref:MATE family efflux transporter n=1 Tax=Nonomuraea sp. NPDC050310 TaxID=3154935 RepID=UPI0033DE541C
MITSLVGVLIGTAVLGHHATAALVAFALSQAVLNPATAAVAGALRGMSPFLAPHRGNPAAALPVLRDARWLALSLGTAGAVVVACTPLIARASGAPAEVLAELGALPWWLAAYIAVFAASGGAGAALIALGRSRPVFWASLAATITEVVLALVLVPVLGLPGMGLAFLASALVSTQVAGFFLRRVPGLESYSAWPGRPRTAEILRMARVGLPMAGTTLVKFAALAVVTYAAARTGVAGAAAHAVLSSTIGFLFLGALAVAMASMPEVARAQTVAEARRVTRAALTVGGGVALVGAVAVLLFQDAIFGLLTPDPAVRGVAASLVGLLVLASLADAVQMVMGFGLSGLKRSWWSLASFAGSYGVLVLAIHPVVSTWGLAGIWWAMLANGVVLIGLQSYGFHRFSGRLETTPPPTTTPSTSATSPTPH